MKASRETEVADQHRYAIAKNHARRRPAAPDVAMIDHVVMKQRCRVDELGRATGRDGQVHIQAAGAPGQHRKQGPQALAASVE